LSELVDLIRPGEGRGLDFVRLDELRKRTGIASSEILKFTMCEMLCNSLDTDATEVRVEIEASDGFTWLTVRDSGSKRLSEDDLRLILDFDNKASSKRGFLRVSRGSLGNALKCIFGYTHALAEADGLPPPEITVSSHGREYRIRLRPDRIADRIEPEIQAKEIEDDGRNAFTVAFPASIPVTPRTLRGLLAATSMVNPRRRISYDISGDQGTLGEAAGDESLRKDTSILWYTPQDFVALFKDFMRARPGTQLKEFISLFRGLTRKSSIRDILHNLNEASNHDSGNETHMQFVPATPISELSDADIVSLCSAMKKRSKTISKRSLPQVLGVVGEEQFEKTRRANGWERLRYTCIAESEDQNARIYPYILELAVFDRGKDDMEGLKVYQCVNFMATTESLFSRSFDVAYRLGRVDIRPEAPVTVLIHFSSPILSWLNYGKSSLYFSEDRIMTKAFDKLLPIPKTPRVYRPPPPPKPLSWVPSGKLGDHAYEARLADFAREIRAIDAKRTIKIRFSSRGWCYALEGQWINKGEFDKTTKALNDCRKIGLLPIDFTAEDQDETRRFAGIHEASNPAALLENLRNGVGEMLEALPAHTTDYWEGEKCYLMICTEKGDLRNLFKPICDEYHVPIVNSKGWYPILLRYHIAKLAIKAEARGLTPVLLLFYDHDPAGLKITSKFRKGLRDISRSVDWHLTNLIIERFGLNKEDIDRYGLTWIENLKTGSGREAKDPDYVLKYGRRKCESNALFKNDETLKAAERICRDAIESYYGKDALERFEEKEKKAKESLSAVYENPLWEALDENLGSLINNLSEEAEEKEDEPLEAEEVSEVEIFRKAPNDRFYYGRCRCGNQFNYDEGDVGRTVRCRYCHKLMKLIKEKRGA